MLIRPARPEDYEAYGSLTVEADALHADLAPRYYRKTVPPSRSREYFESVLGSPRQAMFVAEIDGEVIGVVNLEAREDPDIPVVVPMKWVQVMEIIVTQAHQRKGVGKALVRQAAQWAREKRCADLRLSVSEANTHAKDFYRALGFGIKHEVLAMPLEDDGETGAR